MARRDEVLETAIEMLDEVGLDAFTTRKLAERLEVRASALYRHYPSKQALLDAMAAHVVGEASPGDPATLPGSPIDLLRAVAIGARESMLAHRDGARLLATFRTPADSAREFYERLIGMLIDAGLPDGIAAAAVDAIFAYVNGYTIEEQSRKTGGDGRPAWPRDVRDQGFLAGLELILDGIRSRLPSPGAASAPTPDRR